MEKNDNACFYNICTTTYCIYDILDDEKKKKQTTHRGTHPARILIQFSSRGLTYNKYKEFSVSFLFCCCCCRCYRMIMKKNQDVNTHTHTYTENIRSFTLRQRFDVIT
mgnify:CR=1 FL=1